MLPVQHTDAARLQLLPCMLPDDTAPSDSISNSHQLRYLSDPQGLLAGPPVLLPVRPDREPAGRCERSGGPWTRCWHHHREAVCERRAGLQAQLRVEGCTHHDWLRPVVPGHLHLCHQEV